MRFMLPKIFEETEGRSEMSVLNFMISSVVIVFGALIFFRLLIRGSFTGNKYAKSDGKIWVKHPGGGWMRLDEHQRRQKELREKR